MRIIIPWADCIEYQFPALNGRKDKMKIKLSLVLTSFFTYFFVTANIVDHWGSTVHRKHRKTSTLFVGW